MTEILPNIHAIELPSSLKWNEIEKQAQALVKQGFGLLWDFNFPITSCQLEESTIKVWEFTLEYFHKTLFSQFEKETKGAILYKGSSDFGLDAGWKLEDEENYFLFLEGKKPNIYNLRLFCRDQGFQKLKGLSPFLSDTISLFLLFEEMDFILAEYSYDYFILGAKEAFHIFPIWNWTGSRLEKQMREPSRSALLLPSLISMNENEFLKIRQYLNSNPDCRLIPESVLTHEWKGLDELHVFENLLTNQIRRKVRGFEASGGQIIYF